MAELAWACHITRANQGAIASENPHFDKDEFDKWVSDHELAYFVRDPGYAFDCKYMSAEVFFQIYRFESGDVDALFRRIVKTP